MRKTKQKQTSEQESKMFTAQTCFFTDDWENVSSDPLCGFWPRVGNLSCEYIKIKSSTVLDQTLIESTL